MVIENGETYSQDEIKMHSQFLKAFFFFLTIRATAIRFLFSEATANIEDDQGDQERLLTFLIDL